MNACWQVGERRIDLGSDAPAVLMGILNVTPDSFSDGGLHAEPAAAIDAAMQMIDEGAAIIDIGGESTRPGAARIDAAEQIRRVQPVIEALRERADVLLSIDTTQGAVARAAVDAGASIINDVAAGQEDASLLQIAAERGCGLVLMHRRFAPTEDSFSDQYKVPPRYDDVLETVRDFLTSRCRAAMAAGVRPEAIVIDPGLGFGKTVQQNYELVRRMGELVAGEFPVLCAASRKSFLGAASNTPEPRMRLAGSLAVAAATFLAGVRLFRVHDVAAHRQALDVARSIAGAIESGESGP